MALLLTIAKLSFEKTETGQEFERFVYTLIQKRLVPSYREAAPSVQVLDLGPLKPSIQMIEGREELATSRRSLKQLLASIVPKGPKAIAIDLDFSSFNKTTYKGQYVTQEDAELFDYCIDITNSGIPVYLGVWRNLELPGDEWLANPKYRKLATAISVPESETVEDQSWPENTGIDTRWSYTWIRSVDSADRLPGIGLSLAGKAAAVNDDPHGPFSWFIESQRIIRLNDRLECGVALVDYGALRVLQQTCISLPDITRLDRVNLAGKIVIIGDAKRFESLDTFVVPGELEPVPGVFLHACAALTYLRKPLYELTHAGRILADIVLVAIVLFSWGVIVTWYKRKRIQVDHAFIQSTITTAVVFGTLAIGIGFVRYFRVVWLDFFLVAAALALHSTTEHTVFRTLPSYWRKNSA